MNQNLVEALGGLGLFLFGMSVMTDGLRQMAGSALRQWLTRFTKTPLRGAVAGATATAIVQSSSVTTVTAVGFVGAGLLTFPQALGIVLGANIGTTLTGWMVAILGFRFSIGTVVMPVILVGAMMVLLGGPRLGAAGRAVAGFGLLFLGIETLRSGLSVLEGVVTPADFPSDTLGGRLVLIGIGAVVTIVMQSSSAGVAMALTAMASGAILLPQAAALVIGMAVGTTFTAMLASVGGTASAKRTSLAHLIFNLLTGLVGLLLLTPFGALAAALSDPDDIIAAQTALAAFMTGFKVIGVAMVLPFAHPFARMIERLVPDRGPALTQPLDDHLLDDPDVATIAALRTVGAISHHLLAVVADGLVPVHNPAALTVRVTEARRALDETGDFLERVRASGANEATVQRQSHALHILDHASRLANRCMQTARLGPIRTDPALRAEAQEVARVCQAALQDGLGPRAAEIDGIRRRLRTARYRYRIETVGQAAGHGGGIETVLLRLDAMRWLHRVCYHLWRIADHLAEAERIGQPAPPPEAEAAALPAEQAAPAAAVQE